MLKFQSSVDEYPRFIARRTVVLRNRRSHSYKEARNSLNPFGRGLYRLLPKGFSFLKISKPVTHSLLWDQPNFGGSQTSMNHLECGSKATSAPTLFRGSRRARIRCRGFLPCTSKIINFRKENNLRRFE
jgi:hypothetical protein